MSGINSVQYKAVQSHYAALADCLDSNPGAKQGLQRSIIAKGWIGPAASYSSDQLIGVAMDKIKNEASVFDDFISLLKSTIGLKDIALMIESKCI